MKNCPKKQCLITTLAVFAFIFLYEYALHGHLLMGLYQQTPSLWRTQAQMAQYMPWFLLRDIALAMTITCFYAKFGAGNVNIGCAPADPNKKACPYQKGLCFGYKVGLIMAIVQATAYMYMPISGELALAWFLGYLFEGLGIGLILAITCKKKDGACT